MHRSVSPSSNSRALKQAVWWAIGLIIVGALAAAWYYQRYVPEQIAPQPVKLPPPEASTTPRYPVPEGPADASEPPVPLPALDESDETMLESLAELLDPSAIEQFLVPKDIVRRAVVTIDNLPREKVAVQLRPVKPTPGRFVRSGTDEAATLSPENYARYVPLVELLQTADTRRAVTIYFRLYPLFQEAYEDLGYPAGHFNDRLIEVIDHLVATPEPDGPVALVRPNVLYEFADPALEMRSAGQKLLIRMGNENSAIVKAKLRELRAELIAARPAVDPETFRDCRDCPEMVVLPPGSYWMGSAAEALDRPFLLPERTTVEQPRHEVTIDYALAVGKTEVTRAEFSAFVEATQRAPSRCMVYDFAAANWVDSEVTWSDPGFAQDDAHPAVCVSWEDAQAYVDWLRQKTGLSYRLPSEAEWEYAARAGTTTLWPWGEIKDDACAHANVSDRAGLAAGVSSAQGGQFDCEDGFAFTAPATFGKANPFGLHGMIGNVGEWQADCLLPDHDGAPNDGRVRLVEGCDTRVLRGGGWFNPPMYNRPAFRYGTGQDEAYVLVGFRVARPMSTD